jgi:hypothetical protein
LNVGPVIPGAAACATVVYKATAITIAKSSFVVEIAFFMFVALIAALLDNVHFRH